MDTNQLTNQEQEDLYHAIVGAVHTLRNGACEDMEDAKLSFHYLDEANRLEELLAKLLPDFEDPSFGTSPEREL